MKLKWEINLFARTWLCSLSEWVKIQYLWWMLNNIYCVPGEKKPPQNMFIFIYMSFEDEKKTPKSTANATLTHVFHSHKTWERWCILFVNFTLHLSCLLYTSDAADDMQCVDLGGRRIIKKRTSRVTRTRREPSQEACFFSSRRRHTRCREVSWARRCV